MSNLFSQEDIQMLDEQHASIAEIATALNGITASPGFAISAMRALADALEEREDARIAAIGKGIIAGARMRAREAV